MVLQTCMTQERQYPGTLQVLCFFLTWSWQCTRAPGNGAPCRYTAPTAPASEIPRRQNVPSLFIFHFYCLYAMSRHFYLFHFPPFSYHVSQHRRTERKGRSILGKIGQVTTETEILRQPSSFSSHITLALLINLLRALTSSFPWPLTLRHEQVTSQVPWAQKRFTLTDALPESKLNTGTGSRGHRNKRSDRRATNQSFILASFTLSS